MTGFFLTYLTLVALLLLSGVGLAVLLVSYVEGEAERESRKRHQRHELE